MSSDSGFDSEFGRASAILLGDDCYAIRPFCLFQRDFGCSLGIVRVQKGNL